MFEIYNNSQQLWQWDVGQRLIVRNDMCGEVHFSNIDSNAPVVQSVYDEDGCRFVDVPDSLLKVSKTLRVYAYNWGGEMLGQQVFIVHPRPMPKNYTDNAERAGGAMLFSLRPETEGHITINEDRTIVVPECLRCIAVEHDHNIETVEFDCPRYWDGHDFSEMQVFVNYKCADGTLGQYHCEQVTVDDSDNTVIHFCWTISRNLTCAKGKISFLVCIKKIGDDGDIANHWSSRLNQEMEVLEGLECPTEQLVSEPDVIEQILARLDAFENGGGGSGLTAAQISALDGMFKIASFTADPTAAYSAFKSAFGIGGDTPDIPDEPDVPAKTLEAIGATYSGGDVPVGTAITDLIGIVVTAHYSDGSMEAVTDYTLTGEVIEGNNTITVSYSGKSATFTVTGVSAGSGSVVDGVIMDDWDVIARNVENGTASTVYALGNTKELPVTYADGTTETFTVELIGFNHDDLTDGGKAGITFGCTNASESGMAFSTNSSAGWQESAVRAHCNGDLFNAMPVKLQSAIKTVNKPVDGGNGNPQLITTADKVWLFSPEELSAKLPTSFYTVTGQGSMYEAYEKIYRRAARPTTNGVACMYWTRSSGIGANGYAFAVTEYDAYNSQVISQSRHISFGFCI